MDLDDQSLRLAEARAGREAFRLLQQYYPFQQYPQRDEKGILRHGHGRRIEDRPMTPRTAELALREDIVHAQGILRGRVFELLAVHPEAATKLPAIYAIGDILGAEQLKNQEPLWDALRRRDYAAAGTELMMCNWDKYYGSSPEKRRAIFSLVLAVTGGATLSV